MAKGVDDSWVGSWEGKNLLPFLQRGEAPTFFSFLRIAVVAFVRLNPGPAKKAPGPKGSGVLDKQACITLPCCLNTWSGVPVRRLPCAQHWCVGCEAQQVVRVAILCGESVTSQWQYRHGTFGRGCSVLLPACESAC